MKNILLTGGTGFLGSHLAYRLYQNYQLILLKRSFSNPWRISDIPDNVLCYDIDKTPINRVFEENRIDAVIHTATCYGRKGESITDIVNANIVFPLKLAELAIRFNTDTFFNTDTIAYKYLNSYSLSKKQFLEWLKQCSDKIRIVNMKLEHIYGPKDDENKFVSFVIRRMLKNEVLDLTPGEQKRDFVFIDDVVNAYIKIFEEPFVSEPFSEFEIGTGQSVTVKDFVKKIHKYINSGSLLNFGAIPYRENEIMESEADISKMTDMSWNPRVSLEEGIHSTVDYEISREQ